MTTKKENQMSTISEENIKEALEAFKSAYKEYNKQYKEKNINIEDVVNLTKGFSGKSTFLASTVIFSVMLAMPLIEFMELMDTAKSLSRIKLLESMSKILKKKIEKDIDNDIDN